MRLSSSVKYVTPLQLKWSSKLLLQQNLLNRENELSEEERKQFIELINGLEEDLKKFENYRIPSNFFGLGAQTIDYIYGVQNQNLIESLSDVHFRINVLGQTKN